MLWTQAALKHIGFAICEGELEPYRQENGLIARVIADRKAAAKLRKEIAAYIKDGTGSAWAIIHTAQDLMGGDKPKEMTEIPDKESPPNSQK